MTSTSRQFRILTLVVRPHACVHLNPQRYINSTAFRECGAASWRLGWHIVRYLEASDGVGLRRVVWHLAWWRVVTPFVGSTRIRAAVAMAVPPRSAGICTFEGTNRHATVATAHEESRSRTTSLPHDRATAIPHSRATAVLHNRLYWDTPSGRRAVRAARQGCACGDASRIDAAQSAALMLF